MIYLDNAATTRVSDKVLNSMLPYFQEHYGNPGSLHSAGRKAAEAISRAREQVANLLHCDPKQVVFTSGGTEGNNMVFKGLANRLRELDKTHIVISAVEHDSVRRAAESLIELGFDVSFALPDDNGQVACSSVESVLRPNTGLVSVMHTNNETGVVNHIADIGDLCLSRDILFHSDCVQAAGSSDLDVDKLHVDFATISSHKIHGPKGVGAVFIRDSELSPLISGGAEQEFGLRGGTENVPGIVGFGEACCEAYNDMAFASLSVTMLKQEFVRKLIEILDNDRDVVAFNMNSHLSPGKILSISIDGVFGETLVLMLDTLGIQISAGSACRSHESEPSEALISYGLSPERARNTVRLSFSSENTQEQIRCAATAFAMSVKTLRAAGLEGHYE